MLLSNAPSKDITQYGQLVWVPIANRGENAADTHLAPPQKKRMYEEIGSVSGKTQSPPGGYVYRPPPTCGRAPESSPRGHRQMRPPAAREILRSRPRCHSPPG